MQTPPLLLDWLKTPLPDYKWSAKRTSSGTTKKVSTKRDFLQLKLWDAQGEISDYLTTIDKDLRLPLALPPDDTTDLPSETMLSWRVISIIADECRAAALVNNCEHKQFAHVGVVGEPDITLGPTMTSIRICIELKTPWVLSTKENIFMDPFQEPMHERMNAALRQIYGYMMVRNVNSCLLYPA
jgi:hypothetical protein